MEVINAQIPYILVMKKYTELMPRKEWSDMEYNEHHYYMLKKKNCLISDHYAISSNQRNLLISLFAIESRGKKPTDLIAINVSSVLNWLAFMLLLFCNANRAKFAHDMRESQRIKHRHDLCISGIHKNYGISSKMISISNTTELRLNKIK